MAAFVVFTKRDRHVFLKPFSDIFNCPSNLAYEMVLVNDDFGIREKDLC